MIRNACLWRWNAGKRLATCKRPLYSNIYRTWKREIGEVYNIGGNNEKANIEIVKLIINTIGKSEDLIEYVKDRPGHDRRYAIDNTKITSQLAWEPSYTFEQGISETIKWYLDNEAWLSKITSGEYLKYYENMYK